LKIKTLNKSLDEGKYEGNLISEFIEMAEERHQFKINTDASIIDMFLIILNSIASM
jgi:hypothetical protein